MKVELCVGVNVFVFLSGSTCWYCVVQHQQFTPHGQDLTDQKTLPMLLRFGRFDLTADLFKEHHVSKVGRLNFLFVFLLMRTVLRDFLVSDAG